MGDWKVWLVAFLGFTAVLAVGVVLIAFDILSAYAARRRNFKRLPPLRPRSRVAMVVRRVGFALLMLVPVLVVGAAAVFGVMHLLTAGNPG
jgi:multisubunit Na+/H+ antiporter MnhB subunit